MLICSKCESVLGENVNAYPFPNLRIKRERIKTTYHPEGKTESDAPEMDNEDFEKFCEIQDDIDADNGDF